MNVLNSLDKGDEHGLPSTYLALICRWHVCFQWPFNKLAPDWFSGHHENAASMVPFCENMVLLAPKKKKKINTETPITVKNGA